MKPPSIPPKPTLPVKGQSASAPSSRRGSVEMEIENVQSSSESLETQSASALRRRAHSSTFLAFQRKLMEYYSTENTAEKETLFQEMVEIANPERRAKRIRADEAQEIDSDLESLRLAEFARSSSRSLPEVSQRKLIIVKTITEYIEPKPTAPIPSELVPIELDDEQASSSSAAGISSKQISTEDSNTQGDAAAVVSTTSTDFKPTFELTETQLAAHLANVQANTLNIKEISLQDDKGQSFTQFYCNDVFIGELTPNDETFRPGMGSAQKYLSAKNSTTVVVEHRRRFKFKNAEEKELTVRKNHLFSELSPQLSATCLNYVIDDKGKIITQNAGTDLHSYLNNNEDSVIDVKSFEDAAKDLKILHKSGVHHLDLKPENLAFDGAKVRMIDTDSMPVLPKANQLKDPQELKILNYVKYPEFTSGYLPSPFQTAIGDLYNRSTNLSQLQKIRTAADNFCFLMCLMEGTENEFFVDEAEATRDIARPRGFGLRENIAQYLDENNLIVTEDEAEIERAEKWADIYVKPAFRASFLEFMLNPLQYARGKKPEFTVSEIIDWAAKPSLIEDE